MITNFIGNDFMEIIEQVLAAKEMRSHGALRRQKQLIGKLMRSIDPTPIRLTLERLNQESHVDKRLFREAEQWRDRIVDGDAETIAVFAADTGCPSEVLLELKQSLDSTRDDRRNKQLRKQIFRELHKQLAARMQNTPA